MRELTKLNSNKEQKKELNASRNLKRFSRKDLVLLLSGVLLGFVLQLSYDALCEEPLYQKLMPTSFQQSLLATMPTSYWRILLVVICGISAILMINYALKQGRAQKIVITEEEKIPFKKIEKRQIPKKVIVKLPIFQACLDHEESIRTSYQTVLAEIQVGLFGFVFILIQLGLTDFLWLVIVAGIVLCLIFVVACDFRAKNVDFWRESIIRLVRGTELEDEFRGAKYGWVPLGRFGRFGEKHLGHWFERVLVPAMIFLWIMTMLLLPSFVK